MSKSAKIALLIAVVVFLIAVVGIVAYCNSLMNVKNAKIASLERQIPSLNRQVLNLKEQLANLSAPNLVSSLSTREVWKFSQQYPGGPNYTIPFDFVQITGTITNTGCRTAHNVGLHVVGYDLNGALIANVTVPLGSGYFGSDNVTAAYGSTTLVIKTLGSGKIANVNESIVHEGRGYDWVVTPVWTDSQNTG